VPPSLVFALILAVTLSLLFHSIFGRKLWQLPCFTVSAIFGLLAGHVIGTLVGWELVWLGNVPLVAATTGALLALWICWFFTSPMHDVTERPRGGARRMVSRQKQSSA
jgi:NhaP-type Na+/H+ or K+/H+ antiporter